MRVQKIAVLLNGTNKPEGRFKIMSNLHFDVKEITERFVRYASVYTQSKEGVPDTPSTPCQFDLAKLLVHELEEMGAQEISLDEEKCYVYATIPATIPAASAEALASRKDSAAKRRENLAPILGLAAHMDTSDAVDASSHPEIHPQVIENYDGQPIHLPATGDVIADSYLQELIGKTLITADGTTVLGGDDKAGVAQIMAVAQFLLSHPEIAHGTIRIMFTPDEEVGNGTLNMDQKRFAVDYAYTIDGGGIGELEYENFNAASAQITIQGHSTHPGSAKGKMRNALQLAMEFNSLLPAGERPEYTEGYEGFYHLDELSGTTDQAQMDYIIRDHDRTLFEKRKETMQSAADTMNQKYGAGTVLADIHDNYYNMAEKVKPHMHLVENAKASMEKLGITPVISPIRGGTDGAVMSFRGIPCPNLFTGSYNYHSRYEYVVAEEMALGAETVLRILNAYAGYELDAEV